MAQVAYADLIVSATGRQAAESRRVRIYCPTVLNLEDYGTSITQIEAGPLAAVVFENAEGTAVGYLLPGDRLCDDEVDDLVGLKAHLIHLKDRPHSPPTLAA